MRDRWPSQWPLALFLIGTGYGVFAAIVSYSFTTLTGVSLWTLEPDNSRSLAYIVLMNLAFWNGWALLVPAILWLSRRYRFERGGWTRALAVHLAGSLVVVGLHNLIVAASRTALQHWWSVPTTFRFNIVDSFFRTLDWEVALYWGFLGLQHALDYAREAREQQVAAAQSATRLVEAQLQALQQQLQPHFLFNTLHAISTLVHRDADKADEMIERLSDLLRVTLHSVGVQEVPVAEELSYLRAYLDIEQVHFGDRLQIAISAPFDTLHALVPNLVLQPLVENAIRHGLEPIGSPGRLEVVVERAGDVLRLRVSDNGRGFARDAREGVGLTNTRARLHRLYGPAATLEVASRQNRGADVVATLPYRVPPTEAA